MPTKLKNFRVTRVDFVDKGASQDATGDGAHVLLFKRATEETEMPEKVKKLADMTPDEVRKHAEKLEAEATTAAEKIEQLEATATETGETVTQLKADVEKLTGAGDEPKDDDVLKGLDDKTRAAIEKRDAANTERIEKAEKRTEAAEKIATEEREQRLTKQYTEEATVLKSLTGKVDEIAGDLRAIDENLEPEVAKRVKQRLIDADGLLQQSALFEKFSRNEGDEEGTAASEVAKRAAELRKTDKGLTIQQATAQVFTEDIALAKRFRDEA